MSKLMSLVGGAVSRVRDAARGVVGATAVAVAAAPVASHAAGVDFTTLTSAVDFTTAVTAVMAVAAAAVLLYLAMAGAKKVLSMIRSA